MKWGSTKGSETLTLTGANFGTDHSVASVIIDGIECVV